MTKGRFDLKFKDGAATGLKCFRDTHDTNYIWPNKRFGDVYVTYRKPEGDWERTDTLSLAEQGLATVDGASQNHSKYAASYPLGGAEHPDLTVTVTFEADDTSMLYTIGISNCSGVPVEIGDLAVPFPMNHAFEWGTKPTESVIRHSFVSGCGSFMFWMRCNGAGPYLTMTPQGRSKLEYYDMYEADNGKPGSLQYRAYIHSAAQADAAKRKGCNWRQPVTSITLAPVGEEGDTVAYPFKFQWAADYDDVRKILVDEGLIDVQVIPGMTVPNDQSAMFSLRTKQPIEALIPEFPEQTQISYIGNKGDNRHIYKARFERLGENSITVKYGGGKHLILEFFCTEPIETLIKKRAAFITKRQHRDPAKWYDGLLAEWNMESKTLLGPDNYDKIKGWRIYAVTCDDPGLSKPAFLAAKNAEFPDQKEVEALDYYIERFVWGGLQRTDEEEYSYGIYGIPDWNALRESEDDGRRGKLHIWRIYDYPHIFLMYWNMYRIGKNHPDVSMYLPKEAYLERAYRTALAMFTIPVETADWSAYKTGLYNELVIEDIVREMKAIGWKEKALRLESHWNKKVLSFVKENADVFGSEYPFDSTGFESTHAIAKYALEHSVNAVDETPKRHADPVVAYGDALKFMEAQMQSNIACRGWLESAYYLYGSDYRASGNAAYTLSYMSQMGGWAILDYALRHSNDPHTYLRLGYASLLSSWALMNSGTPGSDYGYWYPGKENDGGAGGGFEPAPFGTTWLEQEHHRGSWYYSCEIDLGYCGALRGAAAVLADDPVFGLFCYGGEYEKVPGGYEVTMKDGVRRRLYAVMGGRRFGMFIDTDHISSSTPVFFNDDLSEFSFKIESSTTCGHTLHLTVSGLLEGMYDICTDGLRVSLSGGESRPVVVPIAVNAQEVTVSIKKR